FAGGGQADLVGRQTAMFNETLARKAREHGVVLVDLYQPSREEVPRRAELLWKDGYHPSDAGYARWAELMWEGIDSRLVDCGRGDGIRPAPMLATTRAAPGDNARVAGKLRIPASLWSGVAPRRAAARAETAISRRARGSPSTSQARAACRACRAFRSRTLD